MTTKRKAKKRRCIGLKMDRELQRRIQAIAERERNFVQEIHHMVGQCLQDFPSPKPRPTLRLV